MALNLARADSKWLGSRSRPINRPVGPTRRSSSSAWPAAPTVQSTTISPGPTSSAAMASRSMTGLCPPAGVDRGAMSVHGEIVAGVDAHGRLMRASVHTRRHLAGQFAAQVADHRTFLDRLFNDLRCPTVDVLGGRIGI